MQKTDTRTLTLAKFVEKATQIHDDLYDYSLFSFVNNYTKATIVCKKHGEFDQKPHNHLGGQGCPKCRYIKSASALKSTKGEFVKKARLIHEDLYDYSLFDYKNSRTKGKIICSAHGIFEQKPSNHCDQKQGCSKCGYLKNSITQTKFITEFIKKAKLIHNDLYDYSLFDYKGYHKKGIILCRKHGAFQQIANDHLHEHGCPKCANVGVLTKEEFVRKAESVHGDLYDYSLFDYKGYHKKGIIICEKHGQFEQNPHSNLVGSGCPKCSHTISKPEIAWLDSLNIPIRQYIIQTSKRKIKVDGYNPDTNTVYQFHGDYWHGNPKKFPDPFAWNERTKCFMHDLYINTLKTNKLIKNAGYNLVVMWETDFINTPQIMDFK